MRWTIICTLALLGVSAPAPGVTNLLTNPGFFDTDTDTVFGDGWGSFFNADFNEFFGAGNPHASLFADFAGNSGGVFQLAIPGTPGATYQLDLLNTRIEANWDADLYFGFEYYEIDDTTKIGESLTLIDTSTTGDGLVFSTTGTAVPGTAIVRPIVRFDNVNGTYAAQSQANAFVFDTYMSQIPAPGGNLVKNPTFDENSDDFGLGHTWGAFGNSEFNDFFANPHASLFADTAGNAGGFFQQTILGSEDAEYQFTLEDVRIEDNWDADMFFGLEYYAADNATKLGESIVQIDTSTTGDGLSFSMMGAAVAGTVYVRPIVFFDNVNGAYAAQPLANAFVFETTLAEVVGTVPGDADGDGDVDLDDYNIMSGNMYTNVAGGASDGDFDNDGDVDFEDFVIQALNFGDWPAAEETITTPVPEPTSLLTLIVGAAIGLKRWRKLPERDGFEPDSLKVARGK